MLPNDVISRFVFEICTNALFPKRIFAGAMMIYHAYMEYMFSQHKSLSSIRDSDCIIIGITSLVVAVKFNEDFLNTTCEQVADGGAVIRSRSMRIIDTAARAILSYGHRSSLTTEQVVRMKERIKATVSEMSILRIVGDFATFIPVAQGTDNMTVSQLVDMYSRPDCLVAGGKISP